MGGGAAVQKLEYASSNLICELKTTNFRCSLQCQINLVFATQALSPSKQNCNYFVKLITVMFKSPLFFEFILQWWSIIVAFIIKRYNYNYSEYLIVNRPFPF